MTRRSLSHYEIVGQLGAGGMGEVYLADDRKLGRRVALKMLPAELADDPQRLERLQWEARALAALDHPNIVTVHSVEEVDGTHFLTMAYVEGDTLDAAIPREGLPLPRLLELATALADALRAAHEQGLVHRDLKPGNIMIDNDGRLRVLDFGLAKLRPRPSSSDSSQLPTQPMTQEGTILGTYPYMSPEQAEGKPSDPRSDIFSLGTVLYEMATGSRPFTGETPAGMISSILKDDPAPVRASRPELPRHLDRVIRRCVEKDPERRYQTAKDVRNELEELLRESRSGEAVGVRRGGAVDLRQPPRWGWPAALLSVALLAGLIGLWRWVEPPPPTQETAASVASQPTIESLAVLPLHNVSGDPEQEYFTDGMTGALISSLSTIESLKVISRTSSMQYRNSDRRLPLIASELGVDAVVEGSVLREDEQVRIAVQLVQAATDQPLWGGTFERELTSVLALHAEVAEAIAEEVRSSLSPDHRRRREAERLTNRKTYEAYLRGMHHLSKRTDQGLERGIAYLHEAVDEDPADPLAYAGLALGYIRLGHAAGPSDVAFPRAAAAARRALEIDPSLAEAHAALAEAKMYYEWDWDGAGTAFAHAVQLNPSLAEAHAHYAWYHAVFGRWEESIREASLAQELDPLSPVYTLWLASMYRWAGQYEPGVEEARKVLAVFPDFEYAWYTLGGVYTSGGSYQEAIAAYERASAIDPVRMWALAQAYAQAGQLAQSEETLIAYEAAGNPDPFAEALVRVCLGHHQDALDWLEKAYEGRHRWMPWTATWPELQPLHGEARFADLLNRLDLPRTAAN